MNSTLPGESVAAPQPPFEPVQVMDCLPPVPSPMASASSVSTSRSIAAIGPLAQSSETGSSSASTKARQRRDNPTGLTRAEIRLLAEAVGMVKAWHVNHEDDLKKLAQAIRKLKAASGYTFSGGRKR
jgi:hypothetical protein